VVGVQSLGQAVSVALLALWAVSWLYSDDGLRLCVGTRRLWLVTLGSGDLEIVTGSRDQFCDRNSYAPGGDLSAPWDLCYSTAEFRVGGPLWWAFCVAVAPTMVLVLVRQRRAGDAIVVVRTRVGRLVALLKWSATGMLLIGVACWLPVVRAPRGFDFHLDGVYTLNVMARGTHLEIDGWSPRTWPPDQLTDLGGGITAPVFSYGPPPTRFVPLWPIGLTLVLLVAVLWWLNRSGVPAGYCRKCRYDLTGNVSGRCPECGTAAR
jgi:hypothetical protein